jgi:hypothetical protein
MFLHKYRSTAVNLGFLDLSRYIFNEVAPQLYRLRIGLRNRKAARAQQTAVELEIDSSRDDIF